MVYIVSAFRDNETPSIQGGLSRQAALDAGKAMVEKGYRLVMVNDHARSIACYSRAEMVCYGFGAVCSPWEQTNLRMNPEDWVVRQTKPPWE